MKTPQKSYQSKDSGHYQYKGSTRRVVGYVRVSTDMQAAEGLSLEAQQAAIEHYCIAQGLKLVRICKDVISEERISGLVCKRHWIYCAAMPIS